MSILRVRDENGKVHEILAIRGERGPQGEPGPPGYVLTQADKQEIVDAVLEALPDGDEVEY